MKRFKLTKEIMIVLATIFVIVIGAIIVGAWSNDEAMAVATKNCSCGQEVMEIYTYDDTGHMWRCTDDACGKVQMEEHTLVETARKKDDTYHEWYYKCSVCGYYTVSYTTGLHEYGSDGVCIYNGCTATGTPNTGGGGSGGGGSTGGTCTCNGSTSYYKDYRPYNSDTHVCYCVCNICGGEWFDAYYPHYDNDSNGYCDACDESMGGGSGSHTCTYTTSYEQVEGGEYHYYVKTCTQCGLSFAGEDEPHVYGTYKDNGNGTHSATCTVGCGYTLTANHQEIVTTEAVPATCTTAGRTVGKKCSVCNTVTVESTEIPATGHTEVEIQAVPATCTTAGSTAGKKCSVCNTVTVEPTEVPALGHTEVDIEAVPATCTTAGSTAGKKCSVCNTVTVEPTEIPATGHTEVVYIERVEPTCITAGNTEGKKCSVCNTVTVESTEIPATGHTEVDIEAVPATCTTAGSTTGKKCTVCNTVTVEPTEVPATGHNYEDGTCTGCGEKEPISEIEITSTTYKIDGGYILDIQPETKVNELKSNITTNATEIKIYGNDEEVSEDVTLATGMTLELRNGDLNKTFTIIVKGDVNGDGLADFKDLVKINKARLNKITLEEMYFLAADVNEDESLDLKDLSKLNRFRLNKINII